MTRNQIRWKIRISRLIILAVILISIGVGANYFLKNHFLYGTVIEGVNCSFLSVEDAKEKIDNSLGNKIIKFSFASEKEYSILARELGIGVDEKQIEKIFKNQHENPKEQRKYSLKGFIIFDKAKLQELFELIPELQEENMIKPQNAYITWNQLEFSIESEVIGNEIDSDKAFSFASAQIKQGEREISFSSMTNQFPEVYSEDLETERDELNSIVKSSIIFKLSNGEVVTLDVNTIKDWVYQDENGKFHIDIENGVQKFVENLNNLVEEAHSQISFKATDHDEAIILNIPENLRAHLDIEKQTAEIFKMLGNGESYTVEPIYDKALFTDTFNSYVELDISRQHIWLYVNGELIMDTPCVTGNVSLGYDTPTGIFYLLNKNEDVYLEGYNRDGSKYSSFVDYWMRFYEGVGFHDATWRSQFGGNIYLTNGSHGCVNMPKDAAIILYEYINETMPIIVYNSQL